MSETTQVKQAFGTIVHTELATKDLGATKDFFGKVFGWKFDDMETPQGPYVMTMKGETPIGGIRPVTDDEPGPSVMDYLLVADIDKAVADIEAAGGKILVPKQEVGEYGFMSWFQEPGGCAMAVWQAKDDN